MGKNVTLEAWHGLVPRPTHRIGPDRCVIGAVDPESLDLREPDRYPLADGRWYGLWNSQGKRLVAVDGTKLMEFVPGRNEVALVRQEVVSYKGQDLAGKPKTKWRCDTYFERWSLGGQRVSQLAIDASLGGGNLAVLSFPTKHKGHVAKVESADEGGQYRFFVQLGATGEAGDRASSTEQGLTGKPIAVPPDKRASNVRTPPAELERLAKQSGALALLVAQNKAAPAKLISTLATHADPKVRAAAAMHGALPVAAQRKLARDKDATVRGSLLRMSSYYDTKAEQFVRVKPHTTVLAILAKDPEPKVRAKVVLRSGAEGAITDLAAQPVEVRVAAVKWGIPIDRERELARDPSVKVRLKLAVSRHPRRCGRSPSIDSEALELLRNDKSAKVREAAAALTAYPKGTRKPPR